MAKAHNYVHLNLCIALTLGLLTFLAGIDTATAVPVSYISHQSHVIKYLLLFQVYNIFNTL